MELDEKSSEHSVLIFALPFDVEAFPVEALDVEGCGEKSPSLSLSVSLKMILPILRSLSSPVKKFANVDLRKTFKRRDHS